jgi:hypothetical protein
MKWKPTTRISDLGDLSRALYGDPRGEGPPSSCEDMSKSPRKNGRKRTSKTHNTRGGLDGEAKKDQTERLD